MWYTGRMHWSSCTTIFIMVVIITLEFAICRENDPYSADDMRPPVISNSAHNSETLHTRLEEAGEDLRYGAPKFVPRMLSVEWNLKYLIDGDGDLVELGQGTFGAAYLGHMNRADGKPDEVVVVKVLKTETSNTSKFSENELDELTAREMGLMLWLDDVAGMAKLIGAIPVQATKLWHDTAIVMEFVGDPKTLETLTASTFARMKVADRKAITNEPEDRMWLRMGLELAEIITAFHDRMVYYNDMKGNNVVLKRHDNTYDKVLGRNLTLLHVKVIDLGKASLGPKHRSPKKDPEAHLRKYRHLAPETLSRATTVRPRISTASVTCFTQRPKWLAQRFSPPTAIGV